MVSPVFRAMFSGAWVEGHGPFPASPKTIPVPHDDKAARELLCRALHFDRSIPAKPDLDSISLKVLGACWCSLAYVERKRLETCNAVKNEIDRAMLH
jgi:hypothetical protein